VADASTDIYVSPAATSGFAQLGFSQPSFTGEHLNSRIVLQAL
jgi:hypothetical protein